MNTRVYKGHLGYRYTIRQDEGIPPKCYQLSSNNRKSLLVWAIKTHSIHVWYINLHLPYITSSTAQGGGGSFKKRKTIGEIGC